MSPPLALLFAWTALLIGSCVGPGAATGVKPSVSGAAPCQDADALAAWRSGRAAIARGDDRGALPQLKLAIARCPDLVRAHCAYQDAARRVGGASAEEMIARYSGSSPQAGPLPIYLRARLAETAYAQANDLKSLLADFPDFAWARLSLARVDRGQGRLSEALRGFASARRADPGLVEAALERAQVLAELGRAEEAALDYGAYLRQRPEDLSAMREFVSLLLYRIGRAEAASEWIDRLEAAGDRSVALRMDRAAALWRSGRPRPAVEAYLEILTRDPGNARAALNLGLLYYEVVPRDEESRLQCWPKARTAFRMFLANTRADDGDERFERTWAVPYRLRRISALLGPVSGDLPGLATLRWPGES